MRHFPQWIKIWWCFPVFINTTAARTTFTPPSPHSLMTSYSKCGCFSSSWTASAPHHQVFYMFSCFLRTWLHLLWRVSALLLLPSAHPHMLRCAQLCLKALWESPYSCKNLIFFLHEKWCMAKILFLIIMLSFNNVQVKLQLWTLAREFFLLKRRRIDDDVGKNDIHPELNDIQERLVVARRAGQHLRFLSLDVGQVLL